MRYNFSLEPLGRFNTPCMGCGRYYGLVGNHVCPARGETEPNCLECRLRSFTCSRDNKDMIKKLNALGVVFEYQLMAKYPPALYTCYGHPRRLSDEEVASVIEIQNPLYDVQLAEKYPGLFQDKYPQNPKMIRILGSKKEEAEAMQRDMTCHEAGRQTAATAKRSRLANTENRNSATSPQLPSEGNFPIGDEVEQVGVLNTPAVPPPDVTFEQGNPLQHHGNGLATGMGQLAFQGFHNRLENLEAQMSDLKNLVECLIASSSEASKNLMDRMVELQETRNANRDEPTSRRQTRVNLNDLMTEMGCRDPSRVAGVLVKMEKVKAIHLLVLSASRSPSGYLVSANNLEFYAPIARALLNPSMRLLATFGDEAENERFQESIIQHLAGYHLPSLFAKEVRKKVIDKFSQSVPCDENGHHPRCNKIEFPNVSLETPLFGAEYRIADGDPYGQKSYRDLLKSISISFFPTAGHKVVYTDQNPLESMTPNMLAFVEYLMIQTIVGERRNVGRTMTSRKNADLYANLRADTLTRTSNYVSFLSVEALETV